MVIWSSPIELTKQDRVKQVRDWLLRSKLLSSAAMSPADMDRLSRRFVPFARRCCLVTRRR
jgi:hypothetical protein